MPAPEIVLRPAQAADAPALHALVTQAFGRESEAVLVERLRAWPDTVVLLAEADGELAGCVVFSEVTHAGRQRLAGLGPMAIAPFWQGQGIGTLLMQQGLADCAGRGIDAVVVLGHPDFYRRFGFRPAAERGIRCKWVVPEDAFMVAELHPGALAGVRGQVSYRPEFDEV